MSRLFPFRTSIDLSEDRAPRLVDVDEEVADEVFKSLSSQTARKILATLYEDPHTTSELAETVGTSVQNTSYHLDRLRDADLVEVVDTWYSERGTEMKVYAPADESLVVFAGSDKKQTFRKLLSRLVKSVALISVVWFVIDYVLRVLSSEPGYGRDESPSGGEATTVPPNGTTNATNTTTTNTTTTVPQNHSSIAIDSIHSHHTVSAGIFLELVLLVAGVTLLVTVLYWLNET